MYRHFLYFQFSFSLVSFVSFFCWYLTVSSLRYMPMSLRPEDQTKSGKFAVSFEHLPSWPLHWTASQFPPAAVHLEMHWSSELQTGGGDYIQGGQHFVSCHFEKMCSKFSIKTLVGYALHYSHLNAVKKKSTENTGSSNDCIVRKTE